MQVEQFRQLQSSGVLSPGPFLLDTDASGFWPEKRKRNDFSWDDAGKVQGNETIDDDFTLPSQASVAL